jgi:hypothetical protein
MSIADRIAARLQPRIDAVVEQARFEIENVNPRPDRAQRKRDNDEHDAAERRGR